MKTYIWTLPTRIFHWLLAVSFTVAYFLGGEETYLNYHAALGTFIGGLVFFRLIQGFLGPRYARFSDFPISPASIIQFITSMKQSKKLHPGHNPMAALVMILIMVMALLTSVSGMLMLASGETGFWGFRLAPGGDSEIFEGFHEVVANLFLFLVGIHLTGVLADAFFHKDNGTIFSIFTGYKRIMATDASNSLFQKTFSILWFAIPLLMFFYVLGYQPMPTGEQNETEQVEGTDKDEDG
jgi:cytochrome b